MTTPTMDKLQKKARKKADEAKKETRRTARRIVEDDRTEAAAKEARKRWEEIRNTLSSTAEQWADAAEEQWGHAREVTAPRVDQLRKRAAEVVDSDLDWLRHEVSDLAGDLRGSVVRMAADVKVASQEEADRIIAAIQESAAETREAERKRRVRALVGWTAFGMAAGAILALQFGPKRQDEPEVLTAGQHTTEEPQEAMGEDAMAEEDAPAGTPADQTG